MQEKLFLDEAISEIYNFTKGYPRKINMLCHKVLKRLVVQDGSIVDQAFVRDVISSDQQWRLIEQNNVVEVTKA